MRFLFGLIVLGALVVGLLWAAQYDKGPLVINRADIGNQDVKDYATSIGMPILMELPFDRQIAEATTAGKLMARELPGYRELFLNIFHQIAQILTTHKRSNQVG